MNQQNRIFTSLATLLSDHSFLLITTHYFIHSAKQTNTNVHEQISDTKAHPARTTQRAYRTCFITIHTGGWDPSISSHNSSDISNSSSSSSSKDADDENFWTLNFSFSFPSVLPSKPPAKQMELYVLFLLIVVCCCVIMFKGDWIDGVSNRNLDNVIVVDDDDDAAVEYVWNPFDTDGYVNVDRGT